MFSVPPPPGAPRGLRGPIFRVISEPAGYGFIFATGNLAVNWARLFGEWLVILAATALSFVILKNKRSNSTVNSKKYEPNATNNKRLEWATYRRGWTLLIGAGIVVLALGLIGLGIGWYRNRPTPTKQWQIVSFEAVGIVASLTTQWSGGAVRYQLGVSWTLPSVKLAAQILNPLPNNDAKTDVWNAILEPTHDSDLQQRIAKLTLPETVKTDLANDAIRIQQEEQSQAKAFDRVARSTPLPTFTVRFYDPDGFELCSVAIFDLIPVVDEKGLASRLTSNGITTSCSRDEYQRAVRWNFNTNFPNLIAIADAADAPIREQPIH